MNKTIPKWLIWAIATVAFIGFLDATYLTVVHYMGSELNCTNWGSCNEVTTSEYSVIFGIPMALMGAGYYLTILLLSLVYVDTKKEIILKPLLPLTAFGFLFSLLLIYLQLFVIYAICIYCMFSAGTSTTLFILSILLQKKRSK